MTPPNKDKIFTPRSGETRWGDIIEVTSPDKIPPAIPFVENSFVKPSTTIKKKIKSDQRSCFTLIGYPDDEGIQLNGGRLGAKHGPLEFRKIFYKMTPQNSQNKMYDVGDIKIAGTIKDRHEQAIKTQENMLSKGYKTISIGGGHDYGYPDGISFLNFSKNNLTTLEYSTENNKPLIINIDAHLDVRPTEHGINSGTPFFRLVTERGDEFDLVQVGIQKHCNTKKYWDWCTQNGVRVISNNELLEKKHWPFWLAEELISLSTPDRLLFLSVDIDAFAISHAMGCSQSWSSGLEPHLFFQFLNLLLKKVQVQSLGLYELSPALDQNQATTKLTAEIAYTLVENS